LTPCYHTAAPIQQRLPFSLRGFHLGYRKINFRKMLGNEGDQEIEKSEEDDQNVHRYYSTERIK